tara:strand:+ start:61 stop:489 length:429 start_codon:yes stop_codon:yes gene_type:complete
MKKLLLLIFTITISLTLSGCDFFGETDEKPWRAHTYKKAEDKQEFWLGFRETREWCIKEVETELGPNSDSWNKKWYSKPVGCAFHSNNLLLTIFLYETQADKSLYDCVLRAYAPIEEKLKRKYRWILKGYPINYDHGECVWG